MMKLNLAIQKHVSLVWTPVVHNARHDEIYHQICRPLQVCLWKMEYSDGCLDVGDKFYFLFQPHMISKVIFLSEI